MWPHLPGGATNKEMVLKHEKLNAFGWQSKQITLKINFVITLQRKTSLDIFHLCGIFSSFISLFCLAPVHIIQQDASLFCKGVKTATSFVLIANMVNDSKPDFLNWWNRDDNSIVLKRVLYYLGINIKFERIRMDLPITFSQKTLVLILS